MNYFLGYNLFYFTIISLFYFLTATSYTMQAPDEIFAWSRSLAQTFHIAHTRSLYPLNTQDCFVKMLDTFLTHQDKHARFLGPKEYEELLKMTSGEFFGIGIVVAPKKPEDDFILILDTTPDSPSQQKGLQRYDKIIAVDGKPVTSLTTDEVINQLKGNKRYSPVTLEILRDKQAYTYILKRDLIKEQHISCYYLPDHELAYCSLALFTYQVAQQLEICLKKLVSRPLKGIILDLRDNAGGVLQAAVDCAGLFLDEQSLVVNTKDKNGKILEQFYTKRKPLIHSAVPLVILTNNFTASAAEILAGALKVHAHLRSPTRQLPGDVFLVGTQTHGKGSVQEVIPLDKQCAIKITTCLYYLSNNTSLEGTGLEPDFLIEQKLPPTPEMRLISKLYGKEQPKTSEAQKSAQANNKKDIKMQRLELLQQDYQLQSAIHLLSLYRVGKQLEPLFINTCDKACQWLKKHYIMQDKIAMQEIM